jgi:mannonate dehydratase
MLQITDIESFLVRPATENLVVVRVRTSESGLEGIGCATFTQRASLVAEAVTRYLRPLLRGRDPSRIGDLWKLMHTSGYWRGGPVLMNAVSGIDQALWDIKGKRAGMPVYDLIGGRVREGAAVYQHISAPDAAGLIEQAEEPLGRGVRHLRVQIANEARATAGLAAATAGYGGARTTGPAVRHAPPGEYFDPGHYRRSIVSAVGELRSRLPDEVELIHDVHSRLTVREAIALAKELEPFGLFFLEDPLPPEQVEALPTLRAATTTPLAMGELFTHRSQWLPAVRDRLIDFLRLHVSAVGGFTPAWHAAQVCEAFGVQTAWHGPKDTSPIGHAAHLHLDVASPAFGIQEFSGFTEAEHEIFTGLPELEAGYLYPTDRPGWGITFNADAAKACPPEEAVIEWTQARRPDGSLSYP